MNGLCIRVIVIMFANFFRKTVERTLLGRWERTCERLNAIKVNWANTDHCGTCGLDTNPVKILDLKNPLNGKMKTDRNTGSRQDAPR
jgi:hypothetical protein